MTKQLTPELYWIENCYKTNDHHVHISSYLIRANSKYILVDTGSHLHREEVELAIEDLTNGSGVDALLLTHSDLPHAANVQEFRSNWDFDLYASFTGSSASPEALDMGDATSASVGNSTKIFGRKFAFLWPALADVTNTMWILDKETNTLFTGDGFGNYHFPNQCNLTSREIQGSIEEELIRQYHRDALPWIKHITGEKLKDRLDQMFADYDINRIAPTHGNLIEKQDINEYRDKLIQSVDEISNHYKRNILEVE